MRLALVSLAISLPAAGFGQGKIDRILNAISSVTEYRKAAISPDGKRLAYVQALKNRDTAESRNKAIYVLDLAQQGKAAQRITAGDAKTPADERGAAWSPDSSRLAFLSDRMKSGQLQLYVTGLKGGAKKLTSLTGYLADPRWSPDGKRIAILFTENAPRAAGPLEPATKDKGVVEDKFFEQHLAIVDAATGHARSLSPADTYVYEYDWSPDSRGIVYTASKGNGDNNWWIAQLYSIDASNGNVRHLAKPETQIAIPRWSPDGATIAFIGGLMSDEGSTGGDVFTIPAAGGTPRDITPGRKTSPSWLKWTGANRIAMTETVDGGTAITQLDTADGQTETLWKGDETIRAGDEAISLANDGRTSALIRSSWERAPEVWAGRIGDWRPKTEANAKLKASWGKQEKIHWQSGGVDVEGWLIFPEIFDAAKKYPMIVSVHGGPAAAKKPSWPTTFDPMLLSAEGYFVLAPNPRGSYGDGEAFTRANVKDFGYGDLKDILAGVDEAIRTRPVDAKRVGITGWSYGGYMTMWAVTQTQRFRAAVAGAGISNWQSYYGENLIDQWMIPYFGAAVYDDPAVYAKSSPITFIKNVKTPTLIVVGDSDAECPAPQSYEFWHALKTEGVKTQFVIYPNEGHRFHAPEDIHDVMRRMIAWFDENMPPG